MVTLSLSDPALAQLDPLYLKLIKKAFKRELIAGQIDEPTAVLEAKKFMEAVFEGYGKTLTSVEYDSPDYNKLLHLQDNVYQFSVAKNYQQLREVTSLLTTGSYVSFPDFKKKAEAILGEYQIRNLRTEYNVAVGSAQMASKWVDFQKNPEALLQYRTVGDARVGDDHKPLDRITRPVNDNFWKTYYPPNRWNCRCTVVRLNTGTPTPDQETNRATADAYPAKGFATNLAETGFIFPEDSPYFINIPNNLRQKALDLIPPLSRRKT